MGRRKIEIQPITNDRNRAVTYLKRKNGLFKKAYELGVLCSVDVAIIIFNPNGNKLSEFTSTDIESIIRRHSEFQGERDVKTAIDYTDGVKPGNLKGGGGDSDDEEEESDIPGPKATSSGKRIGTKSRPVRSLPNFHEEKPDVDELEHDSASHSTARRSPNPHLQANGSEDERERPMQGRHRTESAARSTINTGRDRAGDDGRGDSWSSPRSSNRQLPGGYPNSHDLLLGNLGLPFSLGHLASQLTPQQLSTLAPHLGALASQQQQLSGLTSQQLNSLSPQHQELLALHAVKQQQQQLHLQQREQLANIQNSLRGAPNRLATLNLNLSGLGNFGNLGGIGGFGALAGLGERDLGSLGLGSSLNGLPIRKMGGSSGSFPSGLTSVTSSGASGAGGHGNSSSAHSSFNHPSLSSNSSFNSSGNTSQEQTTPVSGGGDDGSWLDFLSLPAGRIDPGLSGLGPLSTLALGGVVDRERDSGVRNNNPSDASSLFGLHFGGGSTPNNNNTSNSSNSAFGSGVASGGGYGLGVSLGQSSERGRRTPIERSVSRGENMDVDKESDRADREHERRGRSVEQEERDEEGHSRKRPRWE